MYLKNTSKTVTVMLNTVVGRICMKPGEVINLEHKLLPPVSANIKKTTEEEFQKFCHPEEALDMDKQQTKDLDESNAIANAATKILEDVQNGKKLTPENITEGIKDDSAADFIKKLFIFNTLDKTEEDETEKTPDFESKGEDTNAKPLTVKKTDSNPELEELENQLTELKQAWKDAKQVRKKDKINKQIKEVKKQIDKLKKDLDV